MVYPEPDPIVRLIPEESAPYSFWQMPAQLRSQRARIYLASRCAGLDPIVAWLIAMDVGAENSAYCDEVAALWTDDRLRDAMRTEFPNGIP